MARKEWVHVRLEKRTVERLRSLVEGWVRTEWEGTPYGNRCQWDTHVSVDAIVQELLKREEDHRSRSKRPRSSRSLSSPPPELERPGTGGQDG